MKIPLSRPDISTEEIEAVNEVLGTDTLSIGPNIKKFEKAICNYLGVKNAIAVNSGTSALHILIKSLGIKEGDEVITTPFSFIASSNCLLFERAKPVFVDIENDTLGLDLNKVEEKINKKTKAILTVDVFGHPFNMEKTLDIARKNNLNAIDDACEAFGGEWNGKKVGSFTHSTFSFYPNKQITTAEGGVVVTDDDLIAELCRSFRSQGRAVTGTWLLHERLGFNYRMSELHAALGIVQLRKIDSILKRREEVAMKYYNLLEKIDGVKTPMVSPEVTRMSWFVYVIRLDEKVDRNGVIDYLDKMGIRTKPYFTPIHLQPFYREKFGYKEGDFPITEKVGKSSLALPFFNKITDEELKYVCFHLKNAIEKNN